MRLKIGKTIGFIFSLLSLFLVSMWGWCMSVEAITPALILLCSEEEQIYVQQLRDASWYLPCPAGWERDTTFLRFSDDRLSHITINETTYHTGDEFRLEDYLKDHGSEAPTGYRLQLFDKRGRSVHDGLLYIYDSGETPSLFVSCETAGPEYLERSKERSIHVSYALYQGDGESDASGSSRMKGHGNTSWVDHPKKSWDLKLNEPESLLGMKAQEKWLLIASYDDMTMLRNMTAYQTARMLGCPFSADCAFVNFYFNGDYRGLYLLCHKVDVTGGTVDIHDLETDNDHLNRPHENNHLPVFRKEVNGLKQKGFHLTENPSDITGGYLMEFTGEYPYNEVSTAFTTDRCWVIVKSPNNLSYEESEFIADYVLRAERYLYSDEADYTALSTQYLNIPSWIGYFWLQEFYLNWDASITSTFFYKEQKDPLLYAGPVWDMDKTMDSFYAVGLPAYTECRALLTEGAKNDNGNWGEMPWMKRLIQMPEFRAEAYEFYQMQFRPVLEEVLKNHLPTWIKSIEAALYMDCARWEKDYAESMAGQEHMMTWMLNRIEFMDSYTKNEAAFCKVTFLLDNPWHDLVYCVERGGLLRVCPEVDKATGWYDDEGKRYTNDTVIREDVVLHAR